jgi:hypothetical protein
MIMPNIYFQEKYPSMSGFIDPPSPITKTNLKWWNSITMQYNPELGRGEEPSPYVKKHRAGGTARACPAIADAISHGYVMYSGIDLYFDATTEDLKAQRVLDVPLDDKGNYILYRNDAWQTNDILHTPVGFHPQTFKLDPMYAVRTDPGYSIIITSLFYRDDLPWRFMDAIVDTDTFTIYDHISFWVRDGFKGVIKQGTPMFQVIPFKREEFHMVMEPLNKDKYMSQANGVSSTFTQGYKKHFWKRKIFK